MQQIAIHQTAKLNEQLGNDEDGGREFFLFERFEQIL